MLPGISTACLYPIPTEESLEALTALRPACLEVFINAEQELEPNFLRGLRAKTDAAGTKIVSVHPYISGMEPMFFFSRYPRRFEDGMALYRRFYRAVSILGADSLVFHGDYIGSPLPRDGYFPRFERLWQDAKNHGVSLCQENVARCASGSAEFIGQMRKALPQVEYILDVKQAVRAGEDIWELARLMGGKIRHVHLSDHNKNQSCLPPGKGSFNIPKLLRIIANNGFSGGVIVELYGENFRDIVELSGSFQHLCTTLST
ncbi:MAG: sugar phosphate isomerase/epimerase [Oscillospiraceae bacterium]|nr:sugar phosphate isomerase/epimerase [Oscillospiraceae bacterium]